MCVLFLDTNVFLQCKPLTELPWGDLAAGDELLLLVPRAVQEELDRLKQDGNGRRAKRARKACTFLRELVLSAEGRITLREQDPNVQVSFTPPSSATTTASSLLDMSRPDDRIVGELLAYTQEHPTVTAALLTHDTNPMLTAKRLNLAFLVIPEGWLLPPERDERDKRVSELERKLALFERSAPIIALSVSDQTGGSITRGVFSVRVYPDLSTEEIGGFVAMVRQRHPIAIDFGENAPSRHPMALGSLAAIERFAGYEWTYQSPTKEEIAKYKETEYPAWEEKIQSIFEKLGVRLGYPSRRATIVFTLENKGSVPAENVVVEFTTLGGIVLEPPDWAEKEKGKGHPVNNALPEPPKPPQGTWVRKRTALFSVLESINPPHLSSMSDDLYRGLTIPRGPFVPPPRDRNEFYWKQEKPSKYTDRWVFECVEFRHQVDVEEFKLPLFIREKDSIESGAVVCTVTAKNLPEPVRVTLPVSVEREESDTAKAAAALIGPKEGIRGQSGSDSV